MLSTLFNCVLTSEKDQSKEERKKAEQVCLQSLLNYLFPLSKNGVLLNEH